MAICCLNLHKSIEISKYTELKVIDHDFFLSETPMNHIQMHYKIHKNQKKYHNSHKIAEIMKMFFACFITLSSVFNFLKS